MDSFSTQIHQFDVEGIDTMMNGDLQETYLDFLESQIEIGKDRSCRDLLKIMLDKDFVWLVPNDDNRIADGLDIRAEWFDQSGFVADLGPCSFLEVLIGLSQRMAFITDESAEGWSWQLLTNLGLSKMRDDLSTYKTRKAHDILDTAIWRLYNSDGSGGFFPLLRPKNDQRETELWYQMSAYIREIHPEY
jgi:hypothetical protein